MSRLVLLAALLLLLGCQRPACAATWPEVEDSLLRVRNRWLMESEGWQSEFIGSGFIVGGTHAITCRHVTVVGPRATGILELIGRDGKLFDYLTPSQRSSMVDMDVIRLKSPTTRGFASYRPYSSLQPGEKLWAVGGSDPARFNRSEGTLVRKLGPDEARDFFTRTGQLKVEPPFLLVHDAPLRHGDSGGLLLDKDLNLVGMNFAAAFPEPGNPSTYGFALPIEVILSECSIPLTPLTGKDGGEAPNVMSSLGPPLTDAQMKEKLKTGEWHFEMATREEPKATASPTASPTATPANP